MDISNLPIQIEKIGARGEALLRIGSLPAAIIDPRANLLQEGVVYLVSTQSDKIIWEREIGCDFYGVFLKGCSRDSRLCDIAKKVFEGKLTEKSIGTVYPPLEEGSK